MAETDDPGTYIRNLAKFDQLSIDFEIDLFETSLSFDPDREEVLFALGSAYAQRGHLENGLEVDRRLVQISPQNPIYSYNLACTLSLLGQTEDALSALEQAVDLGFDDEELLRKDPDLCPLRKDRRFQALVQRMV